jgi:peptidoglycan-associated lipoprotein
MRFRNRTLYAATFAAFASLSAGCAHQETTPAVAVDVSRQPEPLEVTVTTTTGAPVATATSGLGVSQGLLRACEVRFDDPDKAPQFDFEQSTLEGGDRSVLEQVATCVTTGPLKGRSLQLIGRADPRGEVEYNMALGERRASSVSQYLTQLGVDSARMTETSRGKLDATGTDDATWKHDRRVDVDLR